MNERWLQLQIEVPAAGVETFSYLLSELGCEGVVTLEEDLDTFIPPDPDTIVSGPQEIKAFFPPQFSRNEIIRQVREKLDELRNFFPDWHFGEPRVSEIEPQDWAEGWKQNFQPFTVGPLLIRPSWTAVDQAHQGPVMELDPGMAFGTGTHGTTKLCLEALAGELSRYQPDDCSVLDVGTGSGILAIAAAKLGAPRVLGCDIEADACRIAAENAASNGVAETVTITNEPLENLSGGHRVILANILAEENVRLAAELVKRLAAPGSLILSGILKEKEQLVRDGFAGFDLDGPEITAEDEWIALIYRKGN